MNEEARFLKFVEELAEISERYGIAIETTGGVHIFDDPEKAKNIFYSTDHTSGDLEFSFEYDAE